MTRSKLDLAKILVSLRGDGSDPEKIAKEMNFMTLCHQIQKEEEKREAEAEAPKVEPEPEAPPEATPEAPQRPRREKHILSWLLDSDTDED